MMTIHRPELQHADASQEMGNSASIRIPTPILEAAALRIDQEVEIREEDGRIGLVCAFLAPDPTSD